MQTPAMPRTLAAIHHPAVLPTAAMQGSAREDQAFAIQLSRLAVRSLHAELRLYPKPGLVSLVDNGSHQDMTAATFVRSLFSLRHYFAGITLAGMQALPFKHLKLLGMRAEQRMLRATGGINTHRGAIFSLGMLAAATGYCKRRSIPLTAASIRAALLIQWGDELALHSRPAIAMAAPTAASHGMRVAEQYAASGAREEAAMGFPSVFEVAMPRLCAALEAGRSMEEAQMDALFALIAHISDTNLYHRGGPAGAALARQSAQKFLDSGATANPQWRDKALRAHRLFVQHRLSPGGAADLLAATCMLHQCMQTPEDD